MCVFLEKELTEYQQTKRLVRMVDVGFARIEGKPVKIEHRIAPLSDKIVDLPKRMQIRRSKTGRRNFNGWKKCK